ncbi:MAG: hypothetical protein COT43_00925 [Candidatus Marinimicrobia bacterium CG08_land_8_20_14_0_20_45_22]|nr:MAG: hypothetical protein COT43_00925 [Candidatus Marinimicrobia bacterium CG08_land_8_20_14_0_20_45_22]
MMRTKKINLIYMVLLTLCFAGLADAQTKFATKEIHRHFAGLTLITADRGSGVGGFYEWMFGTSNWITIQTDLLMVKGSADYPIYDWYTGYYYERTDKRRLVLMPIFFGYKRILFADQLANNFRPFVDFSAGPVVAFDPPNIPDFVDRMKQIDVAYTGALRIGAGVDFAYGPSAIVSFYFGYETIRFSKPLDQAETYYNESNELVVPYAGMKNYSGLIVKIGFGKKY